MVPFAGYAMPVQYPTGIIAEHNWTREHAGLFDVSHMGQAVARRPRPRDHGARRSRRWRRATSSASRPAACATRMLLTEDGGIIDDLMVTRPPIRTRRTARCCSSSTPARKDDRLRRTSARACRPASGSSRADDRALLALQGPEAAAVLARHVPDVGRARLHDRAAGALRRHRAGHVSRSGYTGEDGFEISVAADAGRGASRDALLAEPEVKPIGLGARDSLRLEAGPAASTATTSTRRPRRSRPTSCFVDPEAPARGGRLPRRRAASCASSPRARRASASACSPTARRRPARAPRSRDADGRHHRLVTSGGFGPTVGGPIAMGYVDAPRSPRPARR